MTITFISDHVEQARLRIIEQYKGQQDLQALIDALILPIQDIEDALEQLYLYRSVDTAEGEQLDKAGVIIGVTRVPGQSDDEYRFYLKLGIIFNNNEGTPEEIITAAKFFLSVDYLEYWEVYPAAVSLVVETVLTGDTEFYKNQIKRFLPAGVELSSLVYVDPDEGFRFDELPGLGDTDDADAGGLLADLY